MCTPSRAALMTGRYPLPLRPADARHPVGRHATAWPTDEWLLPQALKEAGYRTAIVGKWHLGHADRKYWPRQRGFDYQYGPLLGEIDYFTHSAHGVARLVPRQRAGRGEGLRHAAARRRRGQADRGPRPEDAALPLSRPSPRRTRRTRRRRSTSTSTRTSPTRRRRAYAAMITAMDDADRPRRSRALEKRGMRDNTLIVFQSDNGGPRSAKFTGEVDMSKSTIPADNGPYRDGKGTLYEGGTRVVALANWPGHIKPGTVVDQPIHIVDMYPTLAALAGRLARRRASRSTAWTSGRRIAEGKPSPRERGRLRHRAVPRRRPQGRLEARLADDAALAGRALQPGEGPVGEDEPRREEPAEGRRAQAPCRGALPARPWSPSSSRRRSTSPGAGSSGPSRFPGRRRRPRRSPDAEVTSRGFRATGGGRAPRRCDSRRRLSAARSGPGKYFRDEP